MADRIPYSELERLLADDTVPDEAIAPFVKPAATRSRAFGPELVADDMMVELPATRGLVGLSVKALNERAHRRRAAAFEEKIDGGWKGLRLLAEGDSWFLYPILLNDVIDNLSADYAIYSEAAAGDTLANMLKGMGRIEERIAEHKLQGFLFSAGGNDIAGEEMVGYLIQQALPAKPVESYLGNRFNNFLIATRHSYDGIFSRLTKRFPDLKIFCHGYDWPFPRATGTWLAPALLAREIPSSVQVPLLRLMINRYYDMLQLAASRYPGKVHIVDCRGSVGEIGEWFDELHPQNAGFARAAERFRDSIDAAYHVTRGTRTAKVARLTWYPHEETSGARREERLFPVGAQVTVGRSPDREIQLPDSKVSRNHARLEIGRTDVGFEDVGSSNGSRIDGVLVKRGRWLPGQLLRIGNYALEVKFVEAPPAARAASMYANQATAPLVGSRGEPSPAPPAGAAKSAGAAALAPAADGEEAPVLTQRPAGGRRLEIVICAGSITQVAARAYALGIFHNVNPMSKRGSAAHVDDMVDGMLSGMVQGGVFDASLGEVSLLPTPRQRSLAELVLVAGLGAFRVFGPAALEKVGEGLARMLVLTRVADVATVPIGMGAGISAKDFVVHFLAGFLRGLQENDHGEVVRKLSIAEIGRERHAALVEEVRALSEGGFFGPQGFEVVLKEEEVGGAETRAAPATAPAPAVSPVYLQVSSSSPDAFDYCILNAALGAAVQSHRRAIDAAAQKEIAALVAQRPRLSPDLGRNLAQAFVPGPMQELIQRSMARPNTHLVVIHDRNSSAIPWEALYFAERCPALEAGLSRVYQVGTRGGLHGRPRLSRNARLRLLVIENPTGDLPGAQNEGRQLRELFEANRGDVTVLSGREAAKANVLRELGSSGYDILHYAGHADFVEDTPEASGLILNDGRLTAADLRQIRTVPQLIFLNACESGRLRSPEAPVTGTGGFAVPSNVSIAESFLLHGIANFIGTYWKVDDLAALQFALTFYGGLLHGQSMSLAMREARKAITSLGPRDWANYMHFGDPLYTLRQE